MRIIYAFLIIISFSQTSAQNFFPVKTGDQFQEEYLNEWYNNFGGGWEVYSYPIIVISDSLIFNNKTYYKYNDKYFSYDSLQQQLLIYINGSSYVAVDFNLPTNSTKILYFLGFPKVWRSYGISVKNILGTDRLFYTMYADTTYEQGPSFVTDFWRMEFSDGIGLSVNYYHKTQRTISFTDDYIHSHTVLLAKIDSTKINSINKNISLVDSIRDRKPHEFGYILEVNIESSLTALVSELYVEYNIFRNGDLIYTQNFDIDKTTLLAHIDIQPDEVEVGDTIKFKCVLQDTSIFNNFRTCPETGYYTFKVISNISSAMDSENIIFSDYNLFQNFPNPFNPITKIYYSIPQSGFVTIKIYDLLGNEIITLLNAEKTRGKYEIAFDGSSLPSGTYFYKMQAGEYTNTKKLILLK